MRDYERKSWPVNTMRITGCANAFYKLPLRSTLSFLRSRACCSLARTFSRRSIRMNRGDSAARPLATFASVLQLPLHKFILAPSAVILALSGFLLRGQPFLALFTRENVALRRTLHRVGRADDIEMDSPRWKSWIYPIYPIPGGKTRERDLSIRARGGGFPQKRALHTRYPGWILVGGVDSQGRKVITPISVMLIVLVLPALFPRPRSCCSFRPRRKAALSPLRTD